MGEFGSAIFLVSTLIILLIIFGVYLYKYTINPVFCFAIYDIGIITLLSTVVSTTSTLYNNKTNALTVTLYLTIVYILGFFMVFLFRRLRFPRLLFVALFNTVENKSNFVVYNNFNQFCLIMFTVILFMLLMQMSGLGTLWFIDPRKAYLSSRLSVTFVYMLFQWTLLTSLLYYLLAKRPSVMGVVILACIFGFMAYFTGSKAVLLDIFVVVVAYYNFFIKKIPMVFILVGLCAAIAFFLILLLLHGSYNEISSAISYFDYAINTGNFLVHFDNFGLQYGYGTFTELWYYVPRILFPNKPYEYGVTLIQKILLPGMAAKGHTAGMLPWALAYLDFGVIGVFFSGVFAGIVRRGAYELFLTHRSSIFAFILMLQLSLYPVFIGATLFLTIIIGAFLASFFSKKIVIFKSSKIVET